EVREDPLVEAADAPEGISRDEGRASGRTERWGCALRSSRGLPVQVVPREKRAIGFDARRVDQLVRLTLEKHAGDGVRVTGLLDERLHELRLALHVVVQEQQEIRGGFGDTAVQCPAE